MKFRFHLLVLAISTMSIGLSGQTYFEATIDESQANAGAGTGSLASGPASLFLNAAQDALEYTITINGLDLDGAQTPGDPNDDVIAMHFHFAPPGVNGPVVFGLIAPGHDGDDLVIDPVLGTISGRWENTDVNPLSAQLTNLLNGNLYINVHTPVFRAGEIRGQILEGAPIPTISQWGIISLSLIMLIIGIVMIRQPKIIIH